MRFAVNVTIKMTENKKPNAFIFANKIKMSIFATS